MTHDGRTHLVWTLRVLRLLLAILTQPSAPMDMDIRDYSRRHIAIAAVAAIGISFIVFA